MYCPRCSQQQISAETKFCSRCGLPLGIIAEALAHNGFLPQLEAINKNKNVFTRRNGLLFALLWFMFFVLILTPFFGIANIDELAGVTAILGTMGSLILLVASFAFLKKEPKQLNVHKQSPETVKAFYQNNQNALPPQQSIPASTYASPAQSNWRDTQDLVQPSVTEGTTKLLSKDER